MPDSEAAVPSCFLVLKVWTMSGVSNLKSLCSLDADLMWCWWLGKYTRKQTEMKIVPSSLVECWKPGIHSEFESDSVIKPLFLGKGNLSLLQFPVLEYKDYIILKPWLPWRIIKITLWKWSCKWCSRMWKEMVLMSIMYIRRILFLSSLHISSVIKVQINLTFCCFG